MKTVNKRSKVHLVMNIFILRSIGIANYIKVQQLDLLAFAQSSLVYIL